MKRQTLDTHLVCTQSSPRQDLSVGNAQSFFFCFHINKKKCFCLHNKRQCWVKLLIMHSYSFLPFSLSLVRECLPVRKQKSIECMVPLISVMIGQSKTLKFYSHLGNLLYVGNVSDLASYRVSCQSLYLGLCAWQTTLTRSSNKELLRHPGFTGWQGYYSAPLSTLCLWHYSHSL